MAGRVKIVVRPSDNVLTVQDAMMHVYDFFQLLNASGEKNADFAWQVVAASTNSPFALEAAPTSVSGADVSFIARSQCAEVERGWRDLARGRVPEGWRGTARENFAKTICKRNQNGIGETVLEFEAGKKPFVITQEVALTALRALESPAQKIPDYLQFSGARQEQGTVEGTLVQATTFRGSPALKIKERKRGFEVWCVVTEEQMNKIAKSANVLDVWNHSRVLVRGTIYFRGVGAIDRVVASNVEIIPAASVAAKEIADKTFTGGMTAAEYLDKLREGDLG